jgi:hypothetical protein
MATGGVFGVPWRSSHGGAGAPSLRDNHHSLDVIGTAPFSFQVKMLSDPYFVRIRQVDLPRLA